MITESDAQRRSSRERLLWSFVASVLLHVVTWVAVARSAQSFLLRNVGTDRETVTASSSPIHIERRSVRQPQRRPNVVRVPQPESEAPQKLSLSLPSKWSKQNYGNKAETNVPVWLDWSKQTANFVPRVMQWQMQASQGYMSRPSLESSVQDVVSSLRAEDAKMYSSKAQRVCGGKRPGWFLSYLKPGDPPVRVEETLLEVGETIYGAIYVRPANQPEDTKARNALNTLCSLGSGG